MPGLLQGIQQGTHGGAWSRGIFTQVKGPQGCQHLASFDITMNNFQSKHGRLSQAGDDNRSPGYNGEILIKSS